MLFVLTETYCNKVNIQITQPDDFIQIVRQSYVLKIISGRFLPPYKYTKKSVDRISVLLRQSACSLFICYLMGLWQLILSEIF